MKREKRVHDSSDHNVFQERLVVGFCLESSSANTSATLLLDADVVVFLYVIRFYMSL